MTILSKPPADQSSIVPEQPAAEPRYVGLATRGIAFALDAAVIGLAALIVGVGAALIISLFHLPKDVRVALAAIGGAAYIVWSVGYFVGFWSATGQTPGARLMRFRVLAAEGGRLKPRRGIVRCIGLVLAALPLFAGYLLILYDRQRRGFADRLARTVVVEAPVIPAAEVRRRERRAGIAGIRSSVPDSPVSPDSLGRVP